MGVLLSCLRTDSEKDAFKDYVTTMLFSIGNVMTTRFGGRWTFPEYRDLIKPRRNDTRTAQEIKDGILSKLATGSENK